MDGAAWQFFLLAGGIYLLVRGAEHLVDGAASLAFRLGISGLLVGLTVVAFGTSAPELATSVSAALRAAAGEVGAADVAIGNVVGSNICNIGLILGVTALMAPLAVDRQLIRREIPFMIALSIFVLVLAWRDQLDGIAGDLLLLCFVAFVAWIVWAAVKERQAPAFAEEVDADRLVQMPRWKAGSHVLLGCLLLTVGADVLVDAALGLAEAFGVSQGIVGLSVVALGTSLPELAACVVAARRGEGDLALGNIVGSNVFNLGLVLGIPAAFIGLPVDQHIARFDMPLMVAFSFLLLPLCMTRRTVSRREGGVLLAGYLIYMTFLAIEAT